jgi:hypothetical protein
MRLKRVALETSSGAQEADIATTGIAENKLHLRASRAWPDGELVVVG